MKDAVQQVMEEGAQRAMDMGPLSADVAEFAFKLGSAI